MIAARLLPGSAPLAKPIPAERTTMSSLAPLVALVGRPNVGKSTLFNRLVGERRAIVEDTPGVTRDRIYGRFENAGRHYRLVDTGGFVVTDAEGVTEHVRVQAEIAIAEADVIVWLGDARADVTVADEEVGSVLRKALAPVLLVINKCDTYELEVDALSFYSLGFETLIPISAEHGRGMLDLVEGIEAALEACGKLPAVDDVGLDPEYDPEGLGVRVSPEEGALEDGGVVAAAVRDFGVVSRIRLAVVGRPNVGKSTLVNRLIGQERVLSSPVPGTTRDAIDVDLDIGDGRYTLIDTAGLRRKARIQQKIEQYAVSQAVRAIERSHVALLLIDANLDLADQDARIANLIERRGRACVIVVNKWDTIDKDTGTMRGYELDLVERMPALRGTPMVFLSALTGSRVDKLMAAVEVAYAAFDKRLPTGQLNRFLVEVQERHQPPLVQGKRLKIYYGAQIRARPPRIALVCNSQRSVTDNWTRFLTNQLREAFDLWGTPIRLDWKRKAARRRRARLSLPDGNEVLEMPDEDFEYALPGDEVDDEDGAREVTPDMDWDDDLSDDWDEVVIAATNVGEDDDDDDDDDGDDRDGDGDDDDDNHDG